MIKYYPNIAKKNDLSIRGSFNNSNIINSSNEIITTKKYGKIKLSDLLDPDNPLPQMILYIYSMETFLYNEINKASRNKDKSKISTLGPYSFALCLII